MKIATSNFGELEVKESDIILFSSGIPGFENLRKFVIVDHETDSPFHFLQSLDNAELVFVILEPLVFFPQYQVKLSKNCLADIGIEVAEEAVILVVVTIPENPKEMTANLQAPLVINGIKKIGKQIILDDNRYATRHRIFEEEKIEKQNP